MGVEYWLGVLTPLIIILAVSIDVRKYLVKK